LESKSTNWANKWSITGHDVTRSSPSIYSQSFIQDNKASPALPASLNNLYHIHSFHARYHQCFHVFGLTYRLVWVVSDSEIQRRSIFRVQLRHNTLFLFFSCLAFNALLGVRWLCLYVLCYKYWLHVMCYVCVCVCVCVGNSICLNYIKWNKIPTLEGRRIILIYVATITVVKDSYGLLSRCSLRIWHKRLIFWQRLTFTYVVPLPNYDYEL